MKRIAPGMYFEQVSQYSGIHFVKLNSHEWGFTKRWYQPAKPEHKAAIVRQARALSRARYPTLAMAISAAKGNRAS